MRRWRMAESGTGELAGEVGVEGSAGAGLVLLVSVAASGFRCRLVTRLRVVSCAILVSVGAPGFSCRGPASLPSAGSGSEEPLLARARALRERRVPEALRAARDEYVRVAQRDPGLADAHAGEAVCSCLLALYGAEDAGVAFARAGSAAEAALSIDDTCGEAHAARGLVAFLFWHDFERSDLAFERALRHRPDLAEAHHWWAMSWVARGVGEEAMRHMHQARQLAPSSRILAVKWGTVLDAAGRSAEALAHLNAVLEEDSEFAVGHRARGSVLLRLQRPREAAASFERAWEVGPQSPVSAAGACYAWARAGETQRARIWADRVDDNAPLERAVVACAFGRFDEAVDQVGRAIDLSDPSGVYLADKPWFVGLREHPRYPRLLQRLGLQAGGDGSRGVEGGLQQERRSGSHLCAAPSSQITSK